MIQSPQKLHPEPRRRRYLLHLFCTHDEGDLTCSYSASIRLWSVRRSGQAETRDCVFADEYALIEAINPLLPHGSDVRDVLSHIESPDGFLYLLYLTQEEAGSLGWRE